MKDLFKEYIDFCVEDEENNMYSLIADYLIYEDNISSPFKVKDKLNPVIWSKDGSIKEKIRKDLILIAEDFLGDDKKYLKVKDIIFTGSMAGYNWSSQSDLDVHVVAVFPEDSEARATLFFYKKSIWNEQHNIKIAGYDVEVFVQEYGKPLYASGIYSLKNKKWTKTPKKGKPNIDVHGIQRKTDRIRERINDAMSMLVRGQAKTAYNEAVSIFDRLKKMRSCGLEDGGEFSVENLTYKVLRREGYLDKLSDLKTSSYDKMRSLVGS